MTITVLEAFASLSGNAAIATVKAIGRMSSDQVAIIAMDVTKMSKNPDISDVQKVCFKSLK